MKRFFAAALGVLLSLCLAACLGTQGRRKAPFDSMPCAQGEDSGISAPVSQGNAAQQDCRTPGGTSQGQTITNQAPEEPAKTEDAAVKLNIQVGPRLFSAVLEDNAAARAFAGMLREAPLVLQMREYSGFEKVGSLGRSLPASDRRTTAQPGDIVLYNGDQIVLLYGSNSWNYTRLGTVESLSGWEEALGSGDVSVTFWAAD